MTTKNREYLKKAEDAEERAINASAAEAKEAWKRIALSYRALAELRSDDI